MLLRGLLLAWTSGVTWGKVVKYEWDVRDWVVDFLRPTKSTTELCLGFPAGLPGNRCGGMFSETAREMPFDMDQDKLKAAQLVNGRYPGPLIEAEEGDTIEVTVMNNLRGEGTTFHWHGLHMRGTPYEDGPFQVAQAPIMPNSNYTYSFEAYPAGTFYYHSHMDALQQSRGLKGPIVIHPKVDPFAHMYTEEMVVMVSDEWENPEVCLKLEGAMPGNPVCSDAKYSSFNGQWGDGSDKYPYPLLTVKPNTCYRMRFINSGSNAENFIITLAGHNMTMIAVDGFEVKPVQVKSFNMHNGERVDVAVCFDQTPGHYLVQAEYDYGCSMLKGKSFPVPGFHPVEACKWHAFIRYENTKDSLPKQYQPWWPHFETPVGTGGGAHPKATTGVVFDTTVRKGWSVTQPLNPVAEPDDPDLRIVMSLGLKGPSSIQAWDRPLSRGRWYDDVNGRRWSWSEPTTPTLHTKGECGADRTPIFNVPENVTNVEIIINNLSPTEHVMHMHGGNFRVINAANFEWCTLEKTQCFVMPEEANPCDKEDRAFGDPDHDSGWMSVPDYHPKVGKTPVRLPWIKAPLYWGCKYNPTKDKQFQNLKTPLVKDTVSVWQRSWTVIRFDAINPGMWLFHCHLQPHIPLGMMMVLNVKPSQHPPIPAKVPTQGPCPVWSWADVYQEKAKEMLRMSESVARKYGKHSSKPRRG